MAKLSVSLLLLCWVCATQAVRWSELEFVCDEEDPCTQFFKSGSSFDKICGQNIDISVSKLENRCRGKDKSDIVSYFCRIIRKCDRRHYPGVELPVLNTCSGRPFEWCYSLSECSPSVWPLYFPTCHGNSQSPIDLEDEWAEFDASLGPIEFINFEYNVELKLENTGRNVEVILEGIGELYVEPFYQFSGAGLPGVYQLAQFHFHWGSIDDQGSEHSRNEKHFPMEVHFVSYDTTYSDVATAAQHPDGLAVFGVFFEIGPDDNESIFEEVVDNLVNVPFPGDEYELEFRPLLEFLPSNTDDYFRYRGSLTTPGCNEVVIWTVLSDTIKISSYQLEKFRQGLTDSIGEQLVDNFRPVQDQGERTVYKSFNKH